MVTTKKYSLVIRWDNGTKKGVDVRKFDSLEDAMTMYNNVQNSALRFAERFAPTANWELTEKQNLPFGDNARYYSFSLEYGVYSYRAELAELDFVTIVDMTK